MAYLEDTEAGVSLYWQIEHNGSWHWEISDYEGSIIWSLAVRMSCITTGGSS